ncbi:MAG: hypothetical protein LBR12_01230 [Opitutaceae bacterium]|nr:hypothetical protein [Opitutaceae bacterium]
MLLDQNEKTLFFKLWFALLEYVNETHNIIPQFGKLALGKVNVPFKDLAKVRNALWNNPGWADDFLAKYDNDEFTNEERAIIVSWRKHHIHGRFIVYKHLTNHSVLMPFEGKPAFYCVHGLMEPLADVLRYPTPLLATTTLLPFKGRIVWDGVATTPDISFGPGYRAIFHELYNNAKRQSGIVKTLPPRRARRKTGQPECPEGDGGSI